MKKEPTAAPAPAAEPDEYEGVGGAYVIDKRTGKRVPAKAASPPDTTTLPPHGTGETKE